MTAITALSLIRALERQAANTDTDWRWRAAKALRECPMPFEVAELDVAAVPRLGPQPDRPLVYVYRRNGATYTGLVDPRPSSCEDIAPVEWFAIYVAA